MCFGSRTLNEYDDDDESAPVSCTGAKAVSRCPHETVQCCPSSRERSKQTHLSIVEIFDTSMTRLVICKFSVSFLYRGYLMVSSTQGPGTLA